jgi:hypothetical protein
MKGAAQDPTGIDLVKRAVHEIDRISALVAECDAVVQKKRAELADADQALDAARKTLAAAEGQLAALVTTGRCGHEPLQAAPPSNLHVLFPAPKLPRAKNEPVVTKPPHPILDEQAIPKVWRIALMLADDPVLDYQGTAAKLWGPGLPKHVAKNRVNANIAQLRKLGVVVESLGNNEFKIDRAKLKSGLPSTLVEASAR